MEVSDLLDVSALGKLLLIYIEEEAGWGPEFFWKYDKGGRKQRKNKKK
jgi:hypothetical protein